MCMYICIVGKCCWKVTNWQVKSQVIDLQVKSQVNNVQVSPKSPDLASQVLSQ